MKGSNKEVIVCNLPNPLNTIEVIKVFVPENAEHEIGFYEWIKTILNHNRQVNAKFSFFSQSPLDVIIKGFLKSQKINQTIEWQVLNNFDTFLQQSEYSDNSLFVIISSRPQYISFKLQLWKFTYYVPKHMSKKNFLIIYPQQEK